MRSLISNNNVMHLTFVKTPKTLNLTMVNNHLAMGASASSFFFQLIDHHELENHTGLRAPCATFNSHVNA